MTDQKVATNSRMERAAKMMAAEIKSGNPRPDSQILEEAGYTGRSLEAPSQVVKRDSFQELLQKYLPEDRVMQRHGELMEADNEHVAAKMVMGAHKLRGRIQDNKQQPVTQIDINFKNNPTTAFVDGESIDISDQYGAALLDSDEQVLFPDTFPSE